MERKLMENYATLSTFDIQITTASGETRKLHKEIVFNEINSNCESFTNLQDSYSNLIKTICPHIAVIDISFDLFQFT